MTKKSKPDARKTLADFTFIDKYARFLPEKKRRETYAEANRRVCAMHETYYADRKAALKRLPRIERFLNELKLLGSQRKLQFGGRGVLQKHARGYNCSFSYCDRMEFFSEALWLLLCGCGTGFSVQKHHVAKLPMVRAPTGSFVTFQIPDTIEGWAQAAQQLMSSYVTGVPVAFDYSKIRPEGSPISTSSGRAPGPMGLRKSLMAVRAILDDVVANKNGIIAPIDAYDIVLHLAECVRSGGIRRSATIALFSKDDEEMMTAKTGDWWQKNPHRALSNNSALLVRATCEREEFDRLMTSTEQFGEPGVLFSSSTEFGTNPCCLPGDEVIHTSQGVKYVRDLVGKPFKALIDGDCHPSTQDGFFLTGTKPVFEVRTRQGHTVRATADHRFLNADGDWVEVKDMAPGTELLRDAYFEHDDITAEVTEIVEVGTEDVYDCTIPGKHAFVASGFIAHNCEIGLYPIDQNGKSGWAFCNLTTVNMATVTSKQDFLERVAVAAELGTLQAGYLDFGFLGEATVNIAKRDMLLGVSLTGMADNPAFAFDAELLRKGAARARKVNAVLAAELGFAPAARITTVKPEGTGSLVLQVGNGVHPHHSRRYIRHVKGGRATDPMVIFMKSRIPEAVIPAAKEGEFTFAFPIDLGEGPLWLKAETDPIDHLEKVRMVQENWVAKGTVRGELTHNVSNTIQVPPNRWKDVADHIWQHRESYAGVSLLGSSGDLDYFQAPFVEVLTEAEIEAKYGNDPERAHKARTVSAFYAMLESVWCDVDFTEMTETEDNSAGTEVVACAGGACSF